MLALPFCDGSLAGVVAFYSIIHIGPNDLPRVFSEMHRVLRPGGSALVSCHGGGGDLCAEGWFGTDRSFHCHLYAPEVIDREMRQAGFSIRELHVRKPCAQEHPTIRVYAWGQKWPLHPAGGRL